MGDLADSERLVAMPGKVLGQQMTAKPLGIRLQMFFVRLLIDAR